MHLFHQNREVLACRLLIFLFNPDSGTYKTIATNSMQINVTEQEKSITGISLLNNPVNKKLQRIIGYWGMLLAAGVYFYLFLSEKQGGGEANIK